MSTVGTLAKGDFVVLDIETSDKVAPAKYAKLTDAQIRIENARVS